MSSINIKQSRLFNLFQAFITEVRSIVHLSAPIIAAQLAQTAIGFIDTVMAGKVSPDDLASVAIGSSIWVPIYLAAGGLLLATTPPVAQYFGAAQYHKIGRYVRQCLWLAVFVGILAFIAVRYTPAILQWMDINTKVEKISSNYLTGISWGMPAVCIYMTLRYFSEGLSRTRPIMIISILGLLANIPLNYIFIYGKLGLPVMGGAGCGWASAIIMWLMLFAIIYHTKNHQAYHSSKLYANWSLPQWPEIWRIMRLGLPISCSIFVEVSVFCVIALLVASLGANVVASHQIALNFASLIFMIPLSLSIALTIRVGHAIGRRDYQAARFSSFSGVALTLCVATCSATILYSLPEQIAAIYTTDSEVRKLAVTLIFFAMVFQLPDGLQVSASGALRGYKDTQVPMYITLIAYWAVALPTGYLLGLSDRIVSPMGPRGFWIGLIAGLSVAGLLLFWRLCLLSRHQPEHHEKFQSPHWGDKQDVLPKNDSKPETEIDIPQTPAA